MFKNARYFIVAMAVGLFCANQLPTARANQAPIAIAITTSKPRYAVGESIVLIIGYTNLSNSAVFLTVEKGHHMAEMHNFITVMGPDGKQASLTQLGGMIY